MISLHEAFLVFDLSTSSNLDPQGMMLETVGPETCGCPNVNAYGLRTAWLALRSYTHRQAVNQGSCAARNCECLFKEALAAHRRHTFLIQD